MLFGTKFGLILKSLVLLNLFCTVLSTLGPSDKKSSKKNKPKQEQTQKEDLSKLADKLVSERNLVKSYIESYHEIIANHDKYCVLCAKTKKLTNKVLGYVTPWNSKGYDTAKTFADKFDYISPVWFQIKRNGIKKYELTGTHDVDINWIKKVKENSNGTVSFVPRILFEKLRMEDLHSLFNNEEEIEALGKLLVDKAAKFNFNGYVFEIYVQLGGHSKSDINHIVTDIANILHKNNKLFFLVIPPPLATDTKLNKQEQNIMFDRDDFHQLKKVVDGFSLMTYDYSSHNTIIGPNAPFKWVKDNVLYFIEDEELPEYKAKILIGLNFFGNAYVMDYNGKLQKQPEPIVGNQLLNMLNKNNPIDFKYDDRSEEHVILIKDSQNIQTLIFYPTLYSIQKRIDLAGELGTGLSIWELGQGLDYFYDLF